MPRVLCAGTPHLETISVLSFPTAKPHLSLHPRNPFSRRSRLFLRLTPPFQNRSRPSARRVRPNLRRYVFSPFAGKPGLAGALPPLSAFSLFLRGSVGVCLHTIFGSSPKTGGGGGRLCLLLLLLHVLCHLLSSHASSSPASLSCRQVTKVAPRRRRQRRRERKISSSRR